MERETLTNHLLRTLMERKTERKRKKKIHYFINNLINFEAAKVLQY
jgi:hypothetical protein